MSSKINITKGSGKSTPKGTTPPTAKTATAKTATAKTATAKTATVTAKAATAKAATAKAATAKAATPKITPIITPKILPPIPILQTIKIQEQKDVDAEDITGDDGEKVFKKVTKVREDSKVNEESEVKTGPDSIDSLLKNTETIVEKVSDLVSKLIKFIKKSLNIKELKKVFFMIFMAIAMAILFMGLNILFGKVIL